MNKIMLIEDNNYLRIKLEKLFIKNNLVDIETLNASLINDSYLTYLKQSIGLYVIDLDNHYSDAIEMIGKIKELEKNDRSPIIALSKNGNLSTLKKAIIAGCDDFILKPFDDNSVVYKVNKLLGMKNNEDFSPNKYIPENINTSSDTGLEWTTDLEINIGSIDKEHRELFSKYDELYNLMKNGKGHEYYKVLVSFLNDYVHTHFEHEQILHKTANYPLLDEHIRIHEEFKESVSNISKAGLALKVSDTELIKISLFVKNWIIHHILIEDAKFGKFLKNNPKTNKVKMHST